MQMEAQPALPVAPTDLKREKSSQDDTGASQDTSYTSAKRARFLCAPALPEFSESEEFSD